jgi:MFS family permease
MILRSLLASRELRILFFAQLLNMFGTTALTLVLSIWTKSLTDSNAAAGMVFLLLAAPSILAPATGLLVDRCPRRLVLMINDLASAALVAMLLLVHDSGDVWLIYLVAFGYGFSSSIYRAARGGLVHSMVPDELLGDVNGLFSALGQGLRIVGPLLGAAIFAGAGGGMVALVDVATLLVSASSFLLLRDVPDLTRTEVTSAAAERPAKLLHELTSGVRHILTTPLLRRIVLASAIAFTAAGITNVAIFALIDDGLRRPPAFLGVLGAVQGAGSVIAGLLVAGMLRWLGEYGTASIGLLLNGVGLATVATATVTGVVAGAVAVGLGLPLVLVATITLLQRRTTNELQGRVITACDAMLDIPFAVAIGLAAGFVDLLGFRPIYLANAAVFLVVGLSMLAVRAQTRPAELVRGAPGAKNASLRADRDVASGLNPEMCRHDDYGLRSHRPRAAARAACRLFGKPRGPALRRARGAPGLATSTGTSEDRPGRLPRP